ncbi:DoxX family protein [Acinetobacter larvae]|uniref:DoxX family protein n=1 Tax=Acinetobacter larvae TaxID=1789224 RepID=A0A1B2M4C7_9GAMM|nr:DoxX family protein [Acinetobacter larvae]AOA59903.1 DoxX family protein [Acinetobacter larvae]
MPNFIQSMIEHPKLWLLARCLMVLLFLLSGFAKLIDVEGSFAEMTAAGLHPAWLFNYASALVLLLGSYFVLFDRALWFGAGMLAVFLLLTILIVHQFWRMDAEAAKLSMYFAVEHLAVIAGLMAMAMASHYRKLLSQMRAGVWA